MYAHDMTMNRIIASTLIALFGFVGIASSPIASASPSRDDSSSSIAGDDNHDGVIDEDESGWDCRTMGNLICGTNH